MKIKICGITNIEDALLCESLGADALGYIFYPNSKRYISAESAAEISKSLSPLTLKVGVFVNASIDEIHGTFDKARLNVVQLHGDESPEFVESLKIPVIKVFRIGQNFDYATINRYNAKYVILDTHSSKEYGGTGKSFEWQNIPPEIRHNVIIAGGVSEDNIEQIVKEIHPYGVDVSTSLESTPGKKDKRKVEIFFKTIRNITC